MEEWPKSFLEIAEAVASEVEQFFQGVAEVVDAVADEVENAFGAEFDQYLQEMLEPISEIYSELEQIAGEPDYYFVYPEEPTAQKNPACIGCCNYHGQVYEGNLLVCGMHPYGWDTEQCPDWESFDTDASKSHKTF
ncbi:MAG: hypothetical protein KME06_14720 [Kastovskya adunca ATA6-11-RM4]|jgi:hypothetical protein|nr:hypothetical protein [Kastovskya adunca ATA6-11-RM4]